MSSKIGSFKFTIVVDDRTGWYLAECETDLHPGRTFYTQGRNMEEMLDMVSDLYATSLAIKGSWWNRLLYRLMFHRKRTFEVALLRLRRSAADTEIAEKDAQEKPTKI